MDEAIAGPEAAAVEAGAAEEAAEEAVGGVVEETRVRRSGFL